VTQEPDQAGPELSAADEQVLRELTERARTGGLKLTGEDGLLGRLTKMIIEGALEGELDDHLGYGKHDPEGRDGGNSRNGYRAKTVLTDTGPVEISVPRDRDSSFEPKIVAKRQRRLTGVDEMVISLSAKGLTHGEIVAHLAEVYGAKGKRSAARRGQAAVHGLRGQGGERDQHGAPAVGAGGTVQGRRTREFL
jgi:putative transposase